MKKSILFAVLLASTLLNSCNSDTKTNSDSDKNSPDHVDKHSGEEITPQAEINSDSTRLEIDTISSAESANDGGN